MRRKKYLLHDVIKYTIFILNSIMVMMILYLLFNILKYVDTLLLHIIILLWGDYTKYF